nr:hypothetical protein [Tanacetum cinerariifolium]
MASQDTRLPKFEADFKQQQGEMTNKIDTFLKAINNRMTGALLSETVKNPKMNVNSTSLVLSARSYPTQDPQCSSQIHSSINGVTMSSKQTNKSQNNQPKVKTQTENKIRVPFPPKCVYFVNTITVIRKEDKSRETSTIESDTDEDICRNTIVDIDKEAKEELDGSEPEGSEGTEEETEEKEDDDPEYFDTFPTIKELGYHEWLFKNPRPPWVSAKVEIRNQNNMKISCMVGKPFVKETGLVYNKEEGTIMFKKGNEKITFKMPHKIERFKHIDFKEIKIDCIPPVVIEGNDDDQLKTHYSDSLKLGPTYRRDKSVTKAIQCLMKMKSRKGEE